jgi:hypothetical protein
MDQIVSFLRQLHLNISCGNTFYHGLDQIRRPRGLKGREKLRLKKILSVLSQSGSEILPTLEVWIRNLSFENDGRKEILERTRLPKIQSFLITGIGFVWLFLSPFILPPDLRPSPLVVTCSIFLNLLGLYVSMKLIARGEKKFFFLDFLNWISTIEVHISAGRSLVQSVQIATTDSEIFINFPKALNNWILYYATATKNSSPLNIETDSLKASDPNFSKSLRPFEHEFEYYTTLLVRAYEQGFPLGKIFKDTLPIHYENFRSMLKKFPTKLLFGFFCHFFYSRCLRLPG